MIVELNNFISNSAEDQGGALIWVTSGKLNISTNSFTNNKSPYGKDIASYPKYITISFITNNDNLNTGTSR